MVNGFVWLAAEALFGFPAICPPAGIMMIVGMIGTIASFYSVERHNSKEACIAVLLPLILPVSILFCGIFLADHEGMTPPPGWAATLVVVFFLAHLPLGGLLVWRLRGVRPLAFFASLTLTGFSWGAAFFSFMSVTGVWV